jgi:hypothetical protein
MTTKYTGLSQTTLDILNKAEFGRTYSIAWDDKGDLTEMKVMSSAKPKASKVKVYAEDFEHIVDVCIAYTSAGSMVLAFEKDTEEDVVVPSHPLGEGFVVYAKKPSRIFNTLEDAVVGLLDCKGDDPEFLRVLRFKRRQNKWFLHIGQWFSDLPSHMRPIVTGKEATHRAYDLENRRHLYDAKTSDPE